MLLNEAEKIKLNKNVEELEGGEDTPIFFERHERGDYKTSGWTSHHRFESLSFYLRSLHLFDWNEAPSFQIDRIEIGTAVQWCLYERDVSKEGNWSFLGSFDDEGASHALLSSRYKEKLREEGDHLSELLRNPRTKEITNTTTLQIRGIKALLKLL
jgi:hypothetical protein